LNRVSQEGVASAAHESRSESSYGSVDWRQFAGSIAHRNAEGQRQSHLRIWRKGRERRCCESSIKAVEEEPEGVKPRRGSGDCRVNPSAVGYGSLLGIKP